MMQVLFKFTQNITWLHVSNNRVIIISKTGSMKNPNLAIINVSHFINEHPVGRLQRIVFALCFFLIALEGFDTAIISFIVPQITREGVIGSQNVALLMGVGMIGLLVGAPIGGVLADKFGRKRVLVYAVSWFGLCCIFSTYVDNTHFFIILRLLAGLGIGAAMPPVANMVAEYCPARHRTSLLAFVFCGFIFGAMAAGISTSILISHIGWRGLLMIGGVVPLFVVGLFTFIASESVLFLVVAGHAKEKIAAVMQRIYPREDFSENSFADGEIPSTGKPFRELFSTPYRSGSLLIWCIQLLAYYVFYQLSSWLPSYLVSADYSPASAAKMATFFQMGSLLGSLCCVVITRRKNGAVVAGVSYVFGVFAMAALTFGKATAYFPVIIFLCGLFIGGPIICVNALATVFYPTALRGLGGGIAVSCGRFGAIIGAFIVGVATTAGFSYPQIFSSSSLVLLFSVTLLFLLRRQLTTKLMNDAEKLSTPTY
jgi:MFS transporter, AAHS family, 4-hydroxybenzoate transporter